MNETGTNIGIGSGRDIDPGASADRIDAGQAIDSGVAIKPADIRLHRRRLIENVLRKRRILGDTRTTPRPMLEGKPDTQPILYVMGRARPNHEIVIVEGITTPCHQRKISTPLPEHSALLGSTHRKSRQYQQHSYQ